MKDGRNVFNQPLKNNLRTYENITTGRGDYYTTNCLLNYNYFNKCYKNDSNKLN